MCQRSNAEFFIYLIELALHMQHNNIMLPLYLQSYVKPDIRFNGKVFKMSWSLMDLVKLISSLWVLQGDDGHYESSYLKIII